MSAFFNPVIASITVRATLGRRRALLFAIPAVVLIALTLAVRATHPAGPRGRRRSSETSASPCCCRSSR